MAWIETRITALSLGLLLLAPANSTASPNDCAADETCSGLLEQGKQAHNQKNYDLAVRSYEAAYAKLADPRLLILIGRSHFKRGDAKQALALFLRAQPELVDEGERQRLEKFIAEAQAALAGPSAAPQQPKPATVSEAVRADSTLSVASAAEDSTILRQMSSSAPDQPLTRYRPYYRRGAIAAAGVATSFIVISIPFLSFHSRENQPTCSPGVPQNECPTVYTGNLGPGLGLLIPGVLATIPFGVLLYLDRRALRRSRDSIAQAQTLKSPS